MKNQESANPALSAFSANVSMDSGTISFSRLRGQYNFKNSHSLPGGRSPDICAAFGAFPGDLAARLPFDRVCPLESLLLSGALLRTSETTISLK